MFDHLGLTTANVEASIRFYTAALEPLGFQLTSRDDSGAGFGDAKSTSLWLYGGGKGKARGVHVAVVAKDRASVDRFYKAGIEAGGKDNGRPGVREDYSPQYYAAFMLDPDGNNVEAVCLK